MYILLFYIMPVLLFFTSQLLTFPRRYDMLIMLGQLSEPSVLLSVRMQFLQVLSTFTWNPLEIRELLVNCFLDAFFASWYNIFVIFTTLMTDGSVEHHTE